MDDIASFYTSFFHCLFKKSELGLLSLRENFEKSDNLFLLQESCSAHINNRNDKAETLLTFVFYKK